MSKATAPSTLQVSTLTFHRQFQRFERQVRRNSDGEPFISFQDGLPARWEDYKADVRTEALRRLAFAQWKRADIGKGKILVSTIRAIEIKRVSGQTPRNNLVAWQNKYGHQNLPHRALLDARKHAASRKAIEAWLFDFYRDRLEPHEAFEQFREIVGSRYDLVAYLFFLRDWKRFMPIAATTFDKAFRLLGIDLVTAHHCSWDNYAAYNDALKAIQIALRHDAGVADARLIDAHSFCWMLVRLKLPKASAVTVIPLPQAITNPEGIIPVEFAEHEGTEFDSVDEEEFIRRDLMRRRLGRLAQDIARQSEIRRLREAGYPNPENVVKAVWNEPARGYDILSRELNDTARHIEVKATRQAGEQLSFFLTPHERRQSQKLSNYYFYLVVGADGQKPKVLVIKGTKLSDKCLTPANYVAAVKCPASKGE